MNINPKTRRQTRSGIVLIVVLVCLSVIGALIFSALQTSLRQRKQLDRELQMEQTRLLAEAGLVHATGLVDQKENLIVIEPALHDKKHAEVKIELTRNSDAVDVTVTAWIGLKDRPETQTRQTLNTNVKVSSEE
jgi:type II secretory pathway pseudopilin PulG